MSTRHLWRTLATLAAELRSCRWRTDWLGVASWPWRTNLPFAVTTWRAFEARKSGLFATHAWPDEASSALGRGALAVAARRSKRSSQPAWEAGRAARSAFEARGKAISVDQAGTATLPLGQQLSGFVTTLVSPQVPTRLPVPSTFANGPGTGRRRQMLRRRPASTSCGPA